MDRNQQALTARTSRAVDTLSEPISHFTEVTQGSQPLCSQPAPTSRLKSNERGNFRFLPGGYPYSAGVVASPGFEVVHATLACGLPWHDGLQKVKMFLESHGLPVEALCGVELRCSQPHSIGGFAEFNQQYRQLLEQWDLLVDDLNPVARTNVSPLVDPPDQTELFAFAFTRPAEGIRPTFVTSGGGELPHRDIDRKHIVRVGETDSEAMIEKARCVAGIMNHRLRHLGVSHTDVTSIRVYTTHPLHEIQQKVLVDELPSCRRWGTHWILSRPPVEEIEFEMDVRGTVTELSVAFD